ncbi:MAG: hypothetical protein M0T74_02485 [Desulfitobacterium hafniense]|nr:hypothetical protein [Desulfitobacterium hafniense]
MDTANISIELHDSVKENLLFNSLSELEISKTTIFKYGILNEEVPKKIKENDFEYLESKIPFLYGLYSDFVELKAGKIISLADGEVSKRLSETIGVGVGLFYTTKLLKVNPNIIKRIPSPKTQKGKYLDFKFTKENVEYEVETKGTVYHSKLNSIIEDVQGKKRDSKTTGCKYGVITLANKEEDKKPSKIVICDDLNNKRSNKIYFLNDYFEYYNLFLSFILDSTYYNRLVAQIDRGRLRRNVIKTNNIKGEYIYNGVKYKGQYFDRRLVLDYIANYYSVDIKLNVLFKLLTNQLGRQKYFLGLDPKIIDYLNNKDVIGLRKYSQERAFIEESKKRLIRDIDGVIFVSSKSGGDNQIEKNFGENEVKERLSYILGSITNTPHECGAPCRSKEKEGKPCEKLTFREHCHFHRN